VTIHNIREWVVLAKDFVLHDGVLGQASAFRAGVEDFFPPRCLSLFTADELQRDVCGVGDNVDDWDEAAIKNLFKLDGKGTAEAFIAVAAIGGNAEALSRRFGPSSPTIKYLVKSLLEASPQQRRQFLSFVTSLPIQTRPWRPIEVVPIVSPSGDFLRMKDPSCMPRANTCARKLFLPKFDNFESFSQVLWAVVREESKHKGFWEFTL
jgi:HECT-domain (ubiquitin-transferase)